MRYKSVAFASEKVHGTGSSSSLQFASIDSLAETHENEFHTRWSHFCLSNLFEYHWGLRCRWATLTIESIEINKNLNESICCWIGAVICYYGSWAKNRPSNGKFAVEDIDPKYCSIIIYCCIGLNEDATIKRNDVAGMSARETNKNEKYPKKWLHTCRRFTEIRFIEKLESECEAVSDNRWPEWTAKYLFKGGCVFSTAIAICQCNCDIYQAIRTGWIGFHVGVSIWKRRQGIFQSNASLNTVYPTTKI